MSIKSEIIDAIKKCDDMAITAGLGVSEGENCATQVAGRTLSALLELEGCFEEVLNELEWWISQHQCCAGHEGDLISRGRAALSRITED